MFQVGGTTVMTAEEFIKAFDAGQIDISETAPVNPFDQHAENLETLADSVADGMLSISQNTGIPDGLTTDDVSEALIQSEMGLATAGKLYAAALRMQAEEWRKAGAALV